METFRSIAFSTTTALGANATYTSPVMTGLQERRLTGIIFADQAGTLYFDHDNGNGMRQGVRSIAITANTPVSFDEPFYGKSMQVRYVNGTTAQTTFDLAGFTSNR